MPPLVPGVHRPRAACPPGRNRPAEREKDYNSRFSPQGRKGERKTMGDFWLEKGENALGAAAPDMASFGEGSGWPT